MHHINFKNCSSVIATAVFFLGGISPVFGATTCPPGETYTFGACTKSSSGSTAQSCPPGTISQFGTCEPNPVSNGVNSTANDTNSSNGTLSSPNGNTTLSNPTGNGTFSPTSYGPGQSFPSGLGGNNSSQSLKNPLKFNSFAEFFTGLLHIIAIFAIPVIILMIIYSGFLYVMARGSEEQVTKATRSLTYAVLGGLIIIGAELILRVIQGTVSQLTI
jgi:Type IV secretion system pilin